MVIEHVLYSDVVGIMNKMQFETLIANNKQKTYEVCSYSEAETITGCLTVEEQEAFNKRMYEVVELAFQKAMYTGS